MLRATPCNLECAGCVMPLSSYWGSEVSSLATLMISHISLERLVFVLAALRQSDHAGYCEVNFCNQPKKKRVIIQVQYIVGSETEILCWKEKVQAMSFFPKIHFQG